MAGVDLNRNPAPVETKERRPAPVKRERAGARAGDRQREGTGAIAGTPKRTNALWFFVALLGGGAGVWWTKNAFSNAWIAATVAAGVVLALIAYYMLNDEDAPEEEGDNVYYLGLLFTLISLMFTLVELFGSDTDAVRNAEKIRVLLENFGIALTSTVAGIAGRVAVQNWQRTGIGGRPEFAEDTAVPTLPPASATSRDLERFNRLVLERIARDLIRGANALARFHRIVRSHASDTESYLRSHSETLIRESAASKDTLQRNAETFARELKSEAESTLETIGDSLGAAAKQAEALPERLGSAHDAYLAEVREVTRSFHDDLRSASNQSLDALRQNFDAAAQQAEALPERLQAAHDGHLAEVRETTRSFHDDLQSASSQSLDALRQNFDAASKQSLSLAQNVSTVHERVGEAFDSFGSGLGRASDASAAFGNSAHQAAKSTTILEGEVDKLRVALAAVHAGAEAMKGTLDAMGELDARIRAGRDAEQTAAEVRQIGETLRTLTAEAAAATERAAEAAALFDALTRSVQTTEGETRRAAEALRVLADEAEARTEALGQRQGSGWRFWTRSR